jgi:uncharacterized protein (TIGR02145 family)
MIKENYLEYLASIKEAMGLQVDWQGKDPIPPTPEIEMVDLGLTSGTLWAATNLGATPGETAASYYGDYYAWGEVETKSNYSWATYTRHTNGTYSNSNKKVFIKYVSTSRESDYWAGGGSADNKLVLDAVDDIVTATYGSGYVMPTIDDIQELINETDKEWVTDYNGITGLNGRKFMKKSDHSVFIFIPAAGRFDGTSVRNTGGCGYVWSSSLGSGNPNVASRLFVDSSNDLIYNDNRCYGYSVRAVSQ